MNRLFLLIPALNETDAGREIVYLKLLGNIDDKSVVSIIRKIVQSMKLVDGENVEVLYDAYRLNRLVNREKFETTLPEMPQLANLLLFFNDAESIQQLGMGHNPVSINGVCVDAGLINAFVWHSKSGDTLLNKDALIDSDYSMDVDYCGCCKHISNVLPCEAADVYFWLVENRNPQRRLDQNYQKHGLMEKHGKKGVRVSQLTYTEEQLKEFLKRAVAAKKGRRELYFKDNENNKIIIFWDENLYTPSYHAMEVSADDAKECQKIYKRGGSLLAKRIEETAKLCDLLRDKE